MRNVHPLSVFVCVMSVTLIAAVASDPLLLFFALVFGISFAALSGVKRFWLYTAVIPAVALINPFFSHRGNTVLFFLNNSAVTLEAIMAGLNAGIMLGALLLWFAAYSGVMTTDKHLYLFGRLTPRLGITLSAALRFVPLLHRRFREISAAQRAMGMYSANAVYDRLKGRLFAFSAAFTWAIENGVVTAMSMSARGYGYGRRSSYSLFRFAIWDGILAAFSLVMAATVMLNLRGLRFVFYPCLSRISGAIVPRLAYALLCAAPSVIEIKERLAWKYSALKISASPTAAPTDLF